MKFDITGGEINYLTRFPRFIESLSSFMGEISTTNFTMQFADQKKLMRLKLFGQTFVNKKTEAEEYCLRKLYFTV